MSKPDEATRLRRQMHEQRVTLRIQTRQIERLRAENTELRRALRVVPPAAETLPSSGAEVGVIQQWQWADCGHSAWFDGEPPFGTKADEVARRTVYLAKPASEPAGGGTDAALLSDLQKRTERAGPGFRIALSYREMKTILPALSSPASSSPAEALDRHPPNGQKRPTDRKQAHDEETGTVRDAVNDRAQNDVPHPGRAY